MKNVQRRLRIGWKHFRIQLLKVIRNPILLILTLVGNIILFSSAAIFYLVEKSVNPSVKGPEDAIWWAFVTISTVGYGDVVPVTIWGRILSVILMLTAGILFLTVVSLLSSVFIELDIQKIEEEVHELQHSLKRVEKNLENEKTKGS